jgi:uncharacterized protein (TIGR03083 family)
VTFDALAVLDRETQALSTALSRARATGALAAPVQGCPGWSVAELGRHVGGVHRWACAALATDRPPAGEPAGPAADDDVPAWCAEGAAELRAALHAVPANRRCWTFDDTDPTAVFWRRRQAHEAALHRWDVETALGAPARIDRTAALDGIAEVLGMFLPRQVRLGRLAATPEQVDLVPVEDAVPRPVRTGTPAGAPVGTVAGPAEALLLLLWRRTPLTDPRLEVHGDSAAVAAALDRPLTP